MSATILENTEWSRLSQKLTCEWFLQFASHLILSLLFGHLSFKVFLSISTRKNVRNAEFSRTTQWTKK